MSPDKYSSNHGHMARSFFILFILLPTSKIFIRCELDFTANITRPITSRAPNCSLKTTKTAEFQVIKSNVFRIVGDYGKIIFNCSAVDYLLDLDFDGTRPSEAIHLYFWKDVQPSIDDNNTINSNVQRYGMEVEILSIRTAFEMFKQYREENRKKNRIDHLVHKDLKAPISYSRTGKYTIRDMYNKTFKLEFYLFLEEPQSERGFIINNFTESILKNPRGRQSENFIVPCRPTHFLTNVTLAEENGSARSKARMLSKNTNFDPTVGFKLVLPESLTNTNVSLTCNIKSWNKLKSYTIPAMNNSDIDYDANYGESDIMAQQKYDSRLVQVNDAGIIVTRDDFLRNLKCSFSIPPESGKFTFQAVGFQHPSAFRFGQEFTLPTFSNLSYYTRAAREDKETQESLIENLEPCGTVYCSNGNNYNYVQYFSGLGERGYEFATGTDWPGLYHHLAPPDTHGRLEMLFNDSRTRNISSTCEAVNVANEKLYSFMEFEFLCRGTPFVMSRPVLWFIGFNNGTKKLAWVDTQSYGARSIFKTKFTPEVNHTFCRVSWYQSDNWRECSINLPFVDSERIKPNITVQESYQFLLHSKDQEITCMATGDPSPNVWWEKRVDPMITLTRKRKFSSTHKFSTINADSAGEYLCVADNDFGDIDRIQKLVTITTEDDSTSPWITVGIAFGILLIFAFAFGGIYYYWRVKTAQMVLSLQEVKDFKEGFDPKQRGEDESASTPQAQPYNRDYEISKCEYQIDHKTILGSGAFGIVKKGIVRGVPAAVKTIKPGADKSYLKSLLSELKILIYLGKHPYLIELIGANTLKLEKGIAYVFVEYCDNGSLLGYLQENREEFYRSREIPHRLDQMHELFKTWALQIAQGMAFLRTNKVIHGDLAARNILLTADLVAKITDFGLSRQLYNYSMYMKQNQEPLPWRWMALESLSDLQFSCESDIWSYGVTLWEIYSLGQVPFPGLSWNVDFVTYLRNGNRMGCPVMASNALYTNIISRCWEEEPRSRPNFLEICYILNPQFAADMEDDAARYSLEVLKEKRPSSSSIPTGPIYANSSVYLDSKRESVMYTIDEENT